MKLSCFNYPEPQSEKGQVITRKTYSLSEQADVLKILTELHYLLGIVLQGSNAQIPAFLFSVSLVFSLRIIIFHILDEVRLLHQLSHP